MTNAGEGCDVHIDPQSEPVIHFSSALQPLLQQENRGVAARCERSSHVSSMQTCM